MSPELQHQVERYARFQTHSLTHILKQELAKEWLEKTNTTLNTGCGTCISKALIMLNKVSKPKIHFIGIKQ